MALRIYRVDERSAKGELVASFLIRAQTPAQAIRHVAKRFACEVATPDDLVQLTLAGVKVQDAKTDE